MKTFDTAPSTGVLTGLQNRDWRVEGALAEFLDNSYGAGRGNATTVWIQYNQTERTVEIYDDGRGMKQIGLLFKLGAGVGAFKDDIGFYGSGGTYALVWLAHSASVITLKRDLGVMHDSVDWRKQIRIDKFPLVSDEWKSPTVRNTPQELLNLGHGTMVRLQLRDGLSLDTKIVHQRLAELFAPGLRDGKKIIWRKVSKSGTSEIPLNAPPINFDAPKTTVRINFAVQVDDGAPLRVEGLIGICKGLSAAKSKIYVGFGHRLIKATRDCFRSPDGVKEYSGIGVTGFLDLQDGWQKHLTTTKENLTGHVWDVLCGAIYSKIEKLLQSVDAAAANLVFQGLAIQLSALLNGSDASQSGAIVDDEAKKKREPVPGPGPRPISDPPDGPIPLPRNEKAEPESPDRDDVPSATEVAIQLVDDAQMGGTLCEVIIPHSKIFVRVNQDHPRVKDASKATPVGSAIRDTLLTREIAAELAVEMGQKHKPILTKMFGAGFRHLTARFSVDNDLARYIHRQMVDKLRDVRGTANATTEGDGSDQAADKDAA